MRTDIDTIVSRVEADGVCVVPDFIPRDLTAQIKSTVDALNLAERESGDGFLESEGANQRVFNLVNKGELFERIEELHARAERPIEVHAFMPADPRELERALEAGVRRAINALGNRHRIDIWYLLVRNSEAVVNFLNNFKASTSGTASFNVKSIQNVLSSAGAFFSE